MNKSSKVVHGMALFATLFGIIGCAEFHRMTTKMDMAVNRFASPGKVQYEGRLKALRPFGSMIALQFDDGRMFDVVDAAPGLVPGDIVRIYQTKRGLEARLWREVEQPINMKVSERIPHPTGS